MKRANMDRELMKELLKSQLAHALSYLDEGEIQSCVGTLKKMTDQVINYADLVEARIKEFQEAVE
jgi:hypothetical protein